MADLFVTQQFNGFSPSRLLAACSTAGQTSVAGGGSRALRLAVRRECPRRPGVYGMLNSRHELIYVGKAKSLRSRLLSYFRPRTRDPKAGRILAQTRTIIWEPATCEFAALLRELELIRLWRPRFNVFGQPGKRRGVYICLARTLAPKLFVTHFPAASASSCFGPVSQGRRVREAVRRLNDAFKLQDCPRKQLLRFCDGPELFSVQRAPGCLRHEIGTCLGPCVAACTSTAYRDKVRAAVQFLAGIDVSVLDELREQMTAAAGRLEFEKAAILRERLELIDWLNNRLASLRTNRQSQTFIYAPVGDDGITLWYFIRLGQVVKVMPAPVHVATAREAMLHIERIFGKSRIPEKPLEVDELDGVLLVAAWFRRYPSEVARTLTPAEAIASCKAMSLQDGQSEEPSVSFRLQPASLLT